MSYKITPINVLCGILLILSILLFIKPGTWGFGIVVGYFLFLICTIGFASDFLLQNLLQNRSKLFLVELFILGLLFFLYLNSKRTKTYIIPNDFREKYVITIYDFPKAYKLPKGWSYQLKIPKNGILYTSSSRDSDLNKTNFITESGLELETKETDLQFGRILDDEIVCNGKNYEFTVWKLEKHCCGYSSSETNRIRQSIKKRFCN